MIRLGVHAGLPRVPGHLGHGEEQEGDAGEEEEDEAGAGTSEGPGVVVLDPDGLLALDHAFHRLAHHFQGDEGTDTWDGDAMCEHELSTDETLCKRKGNVRLVFFVFQNVNAAGILTIFSTLDSPANAKNMPAGLRR